MEEEKTLTGEPVEPTEPEENFRGTVTTKLPSQ